MKFYSLIFLAIFCITINASAANKTNVKSGNWNDGTVWGGTAPATGDNVTIITGTTVTLNTTASVAALTLSGTLSFDATGTARTLTVTSTCTVNSGGALNCAAGTVTTHAFSFTGTTITNNGTFNLVNGTNVCNTTISGSTAQTISGSSGYTFNRFTLNNTGGTVNINYGGGTFTIAYSDATKLGSNITTMDTLVLKRGVLLCCGDNNVTLNHTVANLKLGSSTSTMSSSVNIFTDVATITVNTVMLENDAVNSNVTFHVKGTFISPNMTQANSAIAMDVIGPNCMGGANSGTKLLFDGAVNLPDLFCFIGNSKHFGGTEPASPQLTFNGNVFWQRLKSYFISLPLTSQGFNVYTFYFGKLDSAGVFPTITLNGGTTAAPNTFNIPFKVFNADIQTAAPLGITTIAQISNSQAEWHVNGVWNILSGASMAVHSDDSLLINGSLNVSSSGEIAGSQTGTTDTSYIATQGPILSFGANGQLSVQTPGLGNGAVADSNQNVAFKNRTSPFNWNLNSIALQGKINYSAAAAQTINSRTYNKLSLSGGPFIKTLAGSATSSDSLNIASTTTLADGGFTLTSLKNAVNAGKHSGTGKIIFAGTTNQTLSGAATDWGNIQFNNAAGFTLGSKITVGGAITFTNGLVVTTKTNILSLTQTATVSGASNVSFVNGPVKKITASTAAFTFPTGNKTTYRPMSIIPTSTVKTTWTVQYFLKKFSNTTSFTAPITSVSTKEYWTVVRNTGTSNASLTLNWGTGSGFTDTLGLVAASYNGTSWTNAGKTSSSGTAAAGSITSGVASAFTAFTFGRINGKTLQTESLIVNQPNSIFTAQPNPAVFNLQLNYQSNQSGIVAITVYNLMGQKMMSSVQNAQAGFNQFQLDVSKLTSGIYLLEMNDGKMKQTLKFVKE
jgi:hypothetical protein